MTWRTERAAPLVSLLGAEGFCGTATRIAVGHVHNMTVSWHRRLARVSSAAWGEFDDGYLVDRRDRHSVGWSVGDRFRDPGQGIQFRQYLDPHRRGRGLHRDDHARPLDGCSGVEEYCAAAWFWCCDRSRRFLIQPRPAGRRTRRQCGAVSAIAAMARGSHVA